jgi:hypothetical protein
VQPILNEDQLRLLLGEQHESDTLDYKREIDLVGPGRRRAIVELAKDVGAMASGRGGYLVIGTDDRGAPTGLLTEDQARALDEARLRQMLQRYLPDGIDLRTAVHEIDGDRVALIYVGAHPDGLVIFRADGTYDADGTPRTVFREGEVFIRRGTQSRRWSQEELRSWMRERARREREEAMAEAAAAFRDLDPEAAEGAAVSEAATDTLNWSLDIATLVETVTEHLQRSDDIPFRLLLENAPRHAASALRLDPQLPLAQRQAAAEAAEASIGGILDRLASLAGRGITLRRAEIVDPVLDALITMYNLGFDEQGFGRHDLALPPPRLWRMIIERLYAVGALAARKRDWRTIRRIAEAAPATSDSGYYRTLVRHGHIMAARAGEFEDPNHARVGASLLQLALQHIARLPELRPDAEVDDERLLSGLCQFDLLLALATVDVTGQLSGAVIYPHFKRFYSHRSDPAVVTVLEDGNAREVLFPQDDQSLSDVLWALGRLGEGEFFYVSGWDGYRDARIVRLFDEHPPRGAREES